LAKNKVAVAIPASIISDTPHLREKTSKVGLIGRAAAIFRVDEIIIYRDNRKANQYQDADFIATLLTYMETPQYLRKKIFEIDPRLQCVGILPPLRTPHHPLNKRTENLKIGEYREGVIVACISDGALVDIGVEQNALTREKLCEIGERVTVKIIKVGKQVEVQIANRDEISEYWGYKVTQAMEKHALTKLLLSGRFDLIIGTSKKGSDFAGVKGELARRWKEAANTLIVFGSPEKGLYEMVKEWNMNLHDLVDFVVNTVPAQGTETVRTEEALFATLAILNVQFGV
jgi:hypothetical protein